MYVLCLLGHTLYFPELMSSSVKMGIIPTSGLSHGEHLGMATAGSVLTNTEGANLRSPGCSAWLPVPAMSATDYF